MSDNPYELPATETPHHQPIGDWWTSRHGNVIFYATAGTVIGVLARLLLAGVDPDPINDVLTPATLFFTGIIIELLRSNES